MASDDRRAFRAKRGDVKLAILSILSEKSLTGYGLIKEIKERSKQEWRVSSGSVYPQLESLSSAGLIQAFNRTLVGGGTEHAYRLTDKGRQHVTQHNTRIREIWNIFQPKQQTGNYLEVELTKLNEAIAIAVREDSKNANKIYSYLNALRKQIYSELAD